MQRHIPGKRTGTQAQRRGTMAARTLVALWIVAALLTPTMARAAATAEDKCIAERAKAAGAYAACEQRVQAKLQTNGVGAFPSFDFDNSEVAASKCRVTYTGQWGKLQFKAALLGSSCDSQHPRLVDNGDGTVTDNLTGLQWEKKTNDATVHDAANVYTWCLDANSDGTCDKAGAADGPVFTDFLRSLNSDGCFAGQCDWRLPTRDELQTILADPYTPAVYVDGIGTVIPCATPSCIDPIFGPTQSKAYWSATTDAGLPSTAWYVGFYSSDATVVFWKTHLLSVRAVRGGL
jgi:hypothetical protein